MNKALFGLFALAMLASVSFAQPVDYDMYVRTGACLRYIGPETNGWYVGTYPQGLFEDYKEVDFNSIRYGQVETRDCPRENGVPMCSTA